MRGYNNAQFLLLPRKVARNAANVVSFSMLYFSPSDSAVKPVKKSVVKSTTQFAWVQRILVAENMGNWKHPIKNLNKGRAVLLFA